MATWVGDLYTACYCGMTAPGRGGGNRPISRPQPRQHETTFSAFAPNKLYRVQGCLTTGEKGNGAAILKYDDRMLRTGKRAGDKSLTGKASGCKP